MKLSKIHELWILRTVSIFYGKYQNMLDSKILRDFATNVVQFFRNDFRKVIKKLEKLEKS